MPRPRDSWRLFTPPTSSIRRPHNHDDAPPRPPRTAPMNRCLAPYLRPPTARFGPLRPAVWKRATSTVGVNKTGYIDVKPSEGLLFFDSSSAHTCCVHPY